jgi:tetratricopeptide (TPR) repeat protein
MKRTYTWLCFIVLTALLSAEVAAVNVNWVDPRPELLNTASQDQVQNDVEQRLWQEADAAYNAGNFTEAEAALRKIIEFDPNDAAAHTFLGIVLARQDRYEEAETAYHRAIELEPENAVAYAGLGSALEAQERSEEAEIAYHLAIQAIELNPHEGSAYYNLGVILGQLGLSNTNLVEIDQNNNREPIERLEQETEAFYIPINKEWNGRRLTIEVPEGYEESQWSSLPGPVGVGVTFAFVGAPRDDGTRPMIQIVLVDLPTLLNEEASTIPLEEFGGHMIGGIQRHQENWTVQITDDQLGQLRVKRYAWAGTSSTYPDVGLSENVHMRGIMYVGIDGDIGFSLRTQDFEQYAEVALPIGEYSIETFRLGITESK